MAALVNPNMEYIEEILRKSDFSARSGKHRRKLFRELTAHEDNGGNLLSDEDLNMVAGGAPVVVNKPQELHRGI